MKNILQSKVFIVEDDLFNSNVYLKHLETLGFQNVHCFSNGFDCLNNITEQPEIILLDYHMDDLNGFETLKKIKRFDPNILTVIISGQTDMSVAIDSLKFGAFDYIIKGKYDLKEISLTLERISSFKAASQKKITSFFSKYKWS